MTAASTVVTVAILAIGGVFAALIWRVYRVFRTVGETICQARESICRAREELGDD